MKNLKNMEALGEPSLFVFDTHPIQYRAPVFQELQRLLPDAQFFFFDDHFDGKKWWFGEVGKIPKQTWGVPLTEGYSPRVLSLGRLPLFSRYLKLSRLLREGKPRALLFYGYYLPEHWMLWLLARRYNARLIWIGETLELGTHGIRAYLKKWILPLFFKRVDRIVSIGTKSEAFYRTLGIPPEKVVSSKYCVDVKFFSMSEADSNLTREKVRRAFDIPPDHFLVLFVGRLFERKRPFDMLEIHRRLAGRVEKITTVLVGNGPLEAALRESIQPGERILLPGFQDQSQTRDWYHAADLLVVPSEFETWGLVVNEAFAARRPALVTATCGCADDLVLSGQTGFVFGVGDVVCGSEKIEKLSRDKKLWEGMSRAAFEKVQKEFLPGRFARAITQVLQERD